MNFTTEAPNFSRTNAGGLREAARAGRESRWILGKSSHPCLINPCQAGRQEAPRERALPREGERRLGTWLRARPRTRSAAEPLDPGSGPAGPAALGRHRRPPADVAPRPLPPSLPPSAPPDRAAPPPHLGRHRQVLGRRLQLQHRVGLAVAERRGGLRAAVPEAEAVAHVPSRGRRLRGRRLQHAAGGGTCGQAGTGRERRPERGGTPGAGRRFRGRLGERRAASRGSGVMGTGQRSASGGGSGRDGAPWRLGGSTASQSGLGKTSDRPGQLVTKPQHVT